MAMRASVTVSMALDNKGMFIVMDPVTRVRVSAVDGRTLDAAGTSNTSSNVRASRISINLSPFGGCWRVPIAWIVLRRKVKSPLEAAKTPAHGAA
jgi:hypothetical protein